MQGSQWKSGLCESFFKAGCCNAMCCSCCIYGQIVATLRPDEDACGGNFCGGCCGFCLLQALPQTVDTLFIFACAIPVGTILFPLSTIVHCPTRGAIRRKYNISGNECEDCIVVWCCLCCALAQVFLVHPHSDSSFGSILFLLERQEHHQVCSPKSNLVVQHPTASASPIAPNTMQPPLSPPPIASSVMYMRYQGEFGIRPGPPPHPPTATPL